MNRGHEINNMEQLLLPSFNFTSRVVFSSSCHSDSRQVQCCVLSPKPVGAISLSHVLPLQYQRLLSPGQDCCCPRDTVRDCCVLETLMWDCWDPETPVPYFSKLPQASTGFPRLQTQTREYTNSSGKQPWLLLLSCCCCAATTIN